MTILNDGEFKVADLTLAGFGRKEIQLAEHEMPGLMAMRAEFGTMWRDLLAKPAAAAVRDSVQLDGRVPHPLRRPARGIRGISARRPA